MTCADEKDSGGRLQEISAKLEIIRAAIDQLIPSIAQARKKAYSKEALPADKEALISLENEAVALHEESGALINEMQRTLGIPDELIEEMERREIEGDTTDTVTRKSIAHEQIASTDNIDKDLSKVLESFLSLIDPRWIEAERRHSYQLEDSFLTEPLSIIRGVRIQSEMRNIHRFAQSICVAEALLNQDSNYDFFAGALLIPQLLALGNRIADLRSVSGPVAERLASLWKGKSTFVEATLYELLVAASCARKGRSVEIIPPTADKSPDLRVHDYSFPCIIECKRQQPLTQYEIKEETKMRELFNILYAEAVRTGLRGCFKLALNIEAEQMPVQDIVSCALRQRFALSPDEQLSYEWGTIGFSELPSRVGGSLTRLYSPIFLRDVFGFDFDMPGYDGIICKVDPPESILVDSVSNPIALLWTNNSLEATRKRSRTALSLYANAIKQVPPGEVGIFYMCYQEGAREKIADERTSYFTDEIKKWGHNPSIRIPAFFLTRLVPRPLGDGAPDLIETGMRFLSGLYGTAQGSGLYCFTFYSYRG